VLTTGFIIIYRLVKHFVASKDDKKRAYDMLLNAGLAQGKVWKKYNHILCMLVKNG